MRTRYGRSSWVSASRVGKRRVRIWLAPAVGLSFGAWTGEAVSPRPACCFRRHRRRSTPGCHDAELSSTRVPGWIALAIRSRTSERFLVASDPIQELVTVIEFAEARRTLKRVAGQETAASIEVVWAAIDV
jgi:hypothetical protein